MWVIPKVSARFSDRVLRWFDRHGRHDLPWQQNPTPYRVWVSEIMLQQTQVATVVPFYHRFMARFPEVGALASASLDDVLHHWSGLGYYARARNLHRAATILMQRHAGVFPDDIDALQALPGIGRSTAAAVLSLSRGQSHAILDGNVKRVLARHHAVQGWPGQSAVLKRLWSLSESLTPTEYAGRFNQAMMDLGATLCVRGAPRCTECPVSADCQAFRTGRQREFPGGKPKKSLPERSVRMLLVRNADGDVLLERRPPTGVWGGLWGLPELDAAGDPLAWCEVELRQTAVARRVLPMRRHTFSH
ncbi:MAG: A/G-specific adenine glycosylase, partial [Roseobacter sp.]|nr:A/G-specific adenine glycosylase [Roseobacter sp.]